jgi:hypothetical protein
LSALRTSSPRSTRPCGGKPAPSSSACLRSPASSRAAPHRTADKQTGQQDTNASVQRTSGVFPANAAWLACAAIAHNLLRAAGSLASLVHGKARGATIRRDLIDVAARTARHGRGHITLHLPEAWHHEHEWMTLFTTVCGSPRTAA